MGKNNLFDIHLSNDYDTGTKNQLKLPQNIDPTREKMTVFTQQRNEIFFIFYRIMDCSDVQYLKSI